MFMYILKIFEKFDLSTALLVILIAGLITILFTVFKFFISRFKRLDEALNNHLSHIQNSSEKHTEVLKEIIETQKEYRQYEREEHEKTLEILNRLLGRIE